ncbi:sulfotransferase family protein [Pelagerythrobacter marinus]|uniref:sulfotransferase family protein n=1 Tax=Pelagerythrobacter marinus TaxID=538382 RepID=UPI002036886F|nr:sulfotransferase [Pelagerythrobacter marinus]USA39863.1 sulfotransferase [Pelagerythrobacter marinus]WPZ06006.1 sulfotransferase [Pelagerythrobacter marinus]
MDFGIRAGRRLGAVAPARLEKAHLLEQAAEAAGLDDFGDRWFERPMDVLLDAIVGEARLNAAGDFSAMQQFHHVLRDRLLAQMWFRRHPEILSRPMPRPVVIVGPMRSGTTRMHRLLASDRRFTHMRSFETISPVPRPGFEEVMEGRREDFRPVLARRIMKVARLANPRTLSIHPTGPYEPEEELGLLVASMWGMKHEAQWHVPSYGRWCEGESAVPAYRHMADLLRLVGWSQQASSLRPWILKTPQHMLDLPALLEVFPDARLIFTHRDPLKVVGSAASLAWNQTIIYSDHADPARMGREWLHKTALQVERMRAARETIPQERMIDVQYEDMESDWRGTMERVYRFLGLDMAPALPGMEDYMRRASALKRRPHAYSLDEFGLTSGDVLDRLGDYVRAFDVPIEGTAPARQARRGMRAS